MAKETRDRDSRSVVLGALRRKRRLTVRALAARSGVSEDVLADAEKGGKSAPSVRRLRQLSADLGYPPELSEALVELLDAGGTPPAEPSHPLEPSREEALRLQAQALVQGRERCRLAREALYREWFDRKVEEHRAEARVLGPKVVAASTSARRKLLDGEGPGPLWALVEWLCEASRTAASNSARAAVRLAELALFVARRYQSVPQWRNRLVGYALAFVANARRVSGDLPGADAGFHEAWESWALGQDSVLPLAEWRILDLEAPLRRVQRRWIESIRLHRRTLAIAPVEAQGVILLSLGIALEHVGRRRSALLVFRRARPFILGAGDKRLEFALVFNTAMTLEALGRSGEAEKLMPEIRARVVELRNVLDVTRVSWLQARIDAASDRRGVAASTLEQVRRIFAAHEIAYDAAVAGLEEGVLRLELGQPKAAKGLAREMHWIFKAQHVERDALAAVRLYCQAAQDETLTLELAKRALADLVRAGRKPAGPEAAGDAEK